MSREKPRSYLVSVLAGGGNTDGAGPVVVEMSQLIRQLLEVFWLEPGGVHHHVVAGWVHRPLPHRLGDKEEVVPERRDLVTRKGSNSKNGLSSPLGQSHHVIHHGTAGRVGWLASGLEEPGVDSLADDDVGELQLIMVDPSLHKAFLWEEK